MVGPRWFSGLDYMTAVLLSLYLLISALLPAQSAAAGGAGTAAADFLKIPVGARETALGGALTAASADANAVFYNPAGLCQAGVPEVSFAYNNYFSGISQQWAAGCAPLAGGALGLGVNYLKVDAFPAYDAADNGIGSVSAYDLAGYLGYGRALRTGLRGLPLVRYGASVKYIAERLDGSSASGYGLDAGLQVLTAVKGLRFGIAAENLAASRLEFIGEGARPARSFKAGAAYLAGAAGAPVSALFSLDVDLSGEGRRDISAGVENTLYGAVSLRAGYETFGDVSNGLTFGLGLALPGQARGTRLDYSYGSSYDLGNVHKFGFSWRFGPPPADDGVAAPGAAAAAAARLSGEELLALEFKRQVEVLYGGEPDESYRAAEYLAGRTDPRALEHFISLMYSPEVTRRLAALRGLSLTRGERALKALAAALQDQAPEVRSAAALALGATRNAGVVPALEEALKMEKAQGVKGDILKALGRLTAGKD